MACPSTCCKCNQPTCVACLTYPNNCCNWDTIHTIPSFLGKITASGFPVDGECAIFNGDTILTYGGGARWFNGTKPPMVEVFPCTPLNGGYSTPWICRFTTHGATIIYTLAGAAGLDCGTGLDSYQTFQLVTAAGLGCGSSASLPRTVKWAILDGNTYQINCCCEVEQAPAILYGTFSSDCAAYNLGSIQLTLTTQATSAGGRPTWIYRPNSGGGVIFGCAGNYYIIGYYYNRAICNAADPIDSLSVQDCNPIHIVGQDGVTDNGVQTCGNCSATALVNFDIHE